MDYQAKCGHLFAAKVAVTVELVVTPLTRIVRRSFDEQCGDRKSVV